MSEKHQRSYGLQAPPSLGVEGKKRYGMVMDLRKCTGGGACMMACKEEFGVPLGVTRMWLKEENRGKYPDTTKVTMPALCNHCDYPICVRNCPTNATYKHPDGFVLQRYNRCIGCRTCAIACPYNARHLLPYKRTDQELPTRIVDKCSFCIHRVSRGLQPACVEACTARAIIFGDLNDPESEISKLLHKERVSTLRPDMGTKPMVFYIGLDGGGVADPGDSYYDRSAQLRGEFDDFKRNHKGEQHGDIIESEISPAGMGKQVMRNMFNFVVEIFEKAGIIRH
ncbi:MAG: 4Fe-4S dicluster domain-containing protein [bacterium]|nr:4Fe-4S dicluster domain-containing protein [bacterium]